MSNVQREAEGTGRVRALLLTAGEEEAPRTGPGTQGRDLGILFIQTSVYANIPVVTYGEQRPAAEGEQALAPWSNVNKSMPLYV